MATVFCSPSSNALFPVVAVGIMVSRLLFEVYFGCCTVVIFVVAVIVVVVEVLFGETGVNAL